MPCLHYDVETRSAADLTKVGTRRYAADPSTDVLCVGYAVDDGEPAIWTPGQPVPQPFIEAAINADWLSVTHNDLFEREIEAQVLHQKYDWPIIPLERRRCSMALAQANGLPGSLKAAAIRLGLINQKDQAGHDLMLELCDASIPLDPAKLERLFPYCMQDVRTERELYGRFPSPTPTEQQVWAQDQIINARGFAVDLTLAQAGREIAAEEKADINARLSAVTNGEITTAGQNARILKYVHDRGHAAKSLGKRNVAQILARNPDEETRQVLELRRAGSRTSVTKFHTAITDADADGRVRDNFRYYGGHTGRWAGRSFQPQNLPKVKVVDLDAATEAVRSGDSVRVRALNGGDTLSILSNVVRNVIIAKPGHTLIGADFSAIESRVLAWLAGERWKIDNYRDFDRTGDPKLEPYCVTATRMLLREVTPDDAEGRQQGKTADLALGFAGSAAAWRKFMPDDPRSDEQIVRETVKPWRAAHPAIRRFWYGIEKLFKTCVGTGKPATYGKITAEMVDDALRLTLPSGRCLVYRNARLGPGKFETTTDLYFQDGYKAKQAWFGTIVENIVQGVSRDLLAGAMLRLEAAGFPVVSHCHDEAVCEIPEDQADEARFLESMVTLPDWAKGLPLAAKTWVSKGYGKSEAGAQDNSDDDEPADLGEDTPDELDAILTNDAPTENIEENRGPTSSSQPDGASTPDHDEEKANFKGEEEMSNDPKNEEIIPPNSAPDDFVARLAAAYHAQSRSSESADEGNDDHIGDDEDPADSSGDSGADAFSGDPELGPYVYQNARGDRHAKVTRTPNGKSRFTQQQWDGKAWVAGTPKHKLPYRLPELLAADRGAWVCITEGEKDAVNVAKLGIVATTNPNGANGWNSAKLIPYFAHLRRIAILEDNDAAGRERTKRIIKTLRVLDPMPDIRVVSFPELPDGGDVSDWLAQDRGRGKAELLARIEAVSAGDELDEWDAGNLLGQGLPPPREWIYGRQLCRCFASSLVAPGDIGKTTMRLIQAVELATGRELLGHRIYQRCRVLVVCLEDDRNELHRRLLAICKHHRVDPADLKGWLFCADINGPKLVEAVDGVRLLGALEPMLRKAIELRRPGVVILDPFVKLHALDENNNPDMDFVCSQLVNLAKKYNIAIDSPAHTRKGALIAGDSDNRRGASAQRDAGRLDYTLTAMTEEEAKRFGIEQEERKSYVRLDRAKANIVRAIGASWYHLVSVTLGNVTELYPEGDEVQTLEVWTPPDVWLDLDAERINRILDKIDAGLSDGDRYSPIPSAKKRAAWPIVVEEVPDKAEAQAREVIKSWLKSGILISRKYESPTERKQRDGLFVDPVKRPKP